MQPLTKSCSFTYGWIRWVYIQLLLTLLLSAQTVLSGQIVKYLPGYDGELPFKLETGYISVDDSELFYYFVESEGNPQEDPLFLWLTGGPGCTSFSGLIYEVGPMEFDVEDYTGGLPKLKYYPYARTKAASMIFLDSPVGTGFSYSRTPEGWPSSDTKSAEQSYQFLRKWMVEHPQFLSVQLFIAGDSYSGIPVPLITKKIIEGNKDKGKPYMNIKGYLIGCPRTDSFIDFNTRVEFAHGMALISDDIYENARRSCKENYLKVDPENTECLAALGDIDKCVKDLFDRDILKPKCELFSPDMGENSDRRSLEEGASKFLQPLSISPKAWCTDFLLKRSMIWPNDDSVQEALHVRKGTIRHWERCNHSLSYTQDVSSVIPVHKELSRSALEVLVERSDYTSYYFTYSARTPIFFSRVFVAGNLGASLNYTEFLFEPRVIPTFLTNILLALFHSGDKDMAIPYVGTLKWIKSLNLTLVENWRPWFIDHQVAGYTMKYSDNGYRLTFATVKGAGHPAPEFYRRECYDLFERWVHYNPI